MYRMTMTRGCLVVFICCVSTIALGGINVPSRQISKIKAGAAAALDFRFTYWHNDCVVAGVVEAEIVSRPRNGAVTIQKRQGIITQDMGTMPRCVGALIAGTAIIYTPKKNYRGEEEFSIRYRYNTINRGITTPQNHVEIYKFSIE